VTVAGASAKVRLKEFQLLLALARNAGTLMSRQRLARDVWGYEFLPSSRTIDVHIRRLRQAVEDPSAFRYIHTVHGVGYRFEPELREAP
jgi:DNA-binding response OmpR family regulator